MRKYRIPVPPPSTRPCFFPLPPEMNPPMKSAKNEIAIIMYVSELSWMFVKRSKVAKMKLVTMAMTKITASPYIIAVPICFVSMVFDSLHISYGMPVLPLYKHIPLIEYLEPVHCILSRMLAIKEGPICMILV